MPAVDNPDLFSDEDEDDDDDSGVDRDGDDDENPDEVKAFRDSMFAFFRENQVALVVIKKRGKKGEYSGGPVGFKLEGIIQLYEE